MLKAQGGEPAGLGELERVRLGPTWARRAADFDARVFGEEAWSAAAWAAALVAPSNYCVAYCTKPAGMQARGDIVALGAISLGWEAQVLSLGVAPGWRRRGLGGAMLDELLGAAHEDSRLEAVFLEVRASNEAAVQLYHSRGFAPVGVREGYYHGEDALLMRREEGRTPRPKDPSQ